MLRPHKIRMKTTAAQEQYFVRCCGVARFTYNWALAEWKRQYEAGEKPNAFALAKQFNAIKREHFPWAAEVSSLAAATGFRNLDRAFKSFFAKRAKHPKFKSKAFSKPAFYAGRQIDFRAEGERIRLPIIGWVDLAEALRFPGQTYTVSVSKEADGWYASVMVETEQTLHREQDLGAVGVDLGIANFAVLSTGEKLPALKPNRAVEARMLRLSRSLSRKVKGGKNRAKARTKLARLHQRVARARNDAHHKLSTRLAQNFSTVVVEGLNVKGMMRNRYLSRSIADAGWAEFRRQLTYKLEMTGGHLIVADRWFPSSKTCSDCGVVAQSMPLNVREWDCPDCGAHHDRDINAAINLRQLAAGPAVTACGPESAGLRLRPQVELAGMKQEITRKTKQMVA
jgi:putative transposase